MPCPCRAHAVSLRVQIVSFPFDLHSAAVFDSHIPCHAHAALLPCSDHAVLKETFQGHGTVGQGRSMGMAWHGMCELTSAVERRPVGDLPAFGFFRLSRRVPRKLSSEFQTEMQLASMKPSNVCHGRGEAYYFGARTRVLCNLQHKYYDNNLVNNNI